MNDRRLVHVHAMLGLLLVVGSAHAGDSPPPLTGGGQVDAPTAGRGDAPAELRLSERKVVEVALAHSPALAASLGELRRAQMLEEAEEHRYSFVLGLDGSATHTRSPSLGPMGVNVPATTAGTVGAELRRHFVLGTDLALRLEGSDQRFQSMFVNPSTNPPSTMLYTMGPAYGATVKLSLKQPILRGAGRNVFFADLDAARASRLSAQSSYDQTTSQLLADVLTAYWELYQASHNVEIQRQSLELARSRFEETAARVRTGSAAQVDQLGFETRVATIEEDLETARADERTKAAELARLVGDPRLASARADTSVAPPEPTEPPPDSREMALAASFEIAQQKAAVRLAEVQARTAEDPFRSKLDVDAYVQAQGLGNKEIPPALDQLAGLGAVSAHIGITYEAPLDGTTQRRTRERALMAVHVAQDRLSAIEQRLTADVDKTLTRETSSRNRLALALKTLRIAEQQLEAETRRFRTGSSTALQVREAEDQVRSAELRAGRARVDLAEAHISVDHLTGRLLGRWGQR